MKRLSDIFCIKKSVIGMIHLSGEKGEIVKRALEELTIYEEEGVHGAIIEDYHGNIEDVIEVLKESQGKFPKLVKGVNVLRNPYYGFELAEKYDAKFVQFDSVEDHRININKYDSLRKKYSDIVVLGGVGFKYVPASCNILSYDLHEAMKKCEAIVTTGVATGVETPLKKLKEYKEIIGNFPLVCGAGVNPSNIKSQSEYCDSFIVGSYFKPNNDTTSPMDRDRVRLLMNTWKDI